MSALLEEALVTTAVTPTDPPAGTVAGVAEDVAVKLGPGVGVGAVVGTGVVAGVAVAAPVGAGVPVPPGVGVGCGGAGVGTGAASIAKDAAADFVPKSDFQPCSYALTFTR